jgi:hypothetical protein
MAAPKSSRTCRLGKRTIEALPLPAEGQAPVAWWDDLLTGFGVRVSDRGTRTYFVQARLPDGHQAKVKIGRPGPVTTRPTPAPSSCSGRSRPAATRRPIGGRRGRPREGVETRRRSSG